MLVHERRGSDGRPAGLELAYATPRAWLRPGKRIVVRRAPTSFGDVSFSIAATAGSVHVTLDVPSRLSQASLSVRLRLPGRTRITAVVLDGRPFSYFDPGKETIDLTGRAGRMKLAVTYATL